MSFVDVVMYRYECWRRCWQFYRPHVCVSLPDAILWQLVVDFKVYRPLVGMSLRGVNSAVDAKYLRV